MIDVGIVRAGRESARRRTECDFAGHSGEENARGVAGLFLLCAGGEPTLPAKPPGLSRPHRRGGVHLRRGDVRPRRRWRSSLSRWRSSSAALAFVFWPALAFVLGGGGVRPRRVFLFVELVAGRGEQLRLFFK